jgi:TolB-like protein
MGLWAEIRKRRVFPWLGAYIAAGFLVLEGMDQLVSHSILPEIAYPLVLVVYLFGIPGTAFMAWFHGEKGTQTPQPIEYWFHGIMAVAVLAVCYVVIQNARSQAAATALALESGLDPQRVAVLYFEDYSPDGELGYLADGLTEALIEQLTQVRALDVISRNGVAPFRGPDIPRDSIARELEAGSLIDGSVEARGDRVRVTVRLVDGASAADFQRRSFDLPAGDLLSIEDSLAADVALFLRERLGEENRLRERRAATSSPEAWALVQRGERLRKDGRARFDHEDYAGGNAAFDEADSLLAVAEIADPSWVVPIVVRGQIAYQRARLAEEASEFEEWTAVGLEHAERALASEPNYPEALELRGTLNYVAWVLNRPADPEEADALLVSGRADLEAATRADPTLAGAYSLLSHLYYQIPDVPAVVLAARRAYEEDAYLDLAPQILLRLFNGSLDLEQIDQAGRWCQEGARRFADDYRFVMCQLRLMTTPALEPDVERAWDLVASIDTLAPEQIGDYLRIEGRMLAGGTLARAGLTDSSRAVLDRANGRLSHEIDPDQELLTVEAYQRTLLGDFDQAVDLLKRFAAANPGHFEGSSSTSWWWRSLRDHPGFQELLGSGRPPSQ